MALLALAVLVVLAVAAPFVQRAAPRRAGAILAAPILLLAAGFLAELPAVAGGTFASSSWPWIPDLGIAFALRVDGLALLFAILVCTVGPFSILHAGESLAGHPRLGRFQSTLLCFMAAMLGLVVADDLILLFAFWELTSFTSFLLIGFDRERADARRAALQALLVTGGGGLALLAGLLLLAIAAGTGSGPVFSVQGLLESEALREPAAWPLVGPAIVLVLAGCFAKSAMVPLHFWLPNAMEAPTPVSALLHSSTMVKAGVYLAARLSPALGGIALWDNLLLGFGAVTMLGAAFAASRHSQLKKILAYTTVSSLGLLMLLLGLGAAKAAAAYLLAHALFKGCLFYCAGILTEETHVKYAEKLSGLARLMPMTAVAAILGALSMAGAFPLFGFSGKELALKAELAAGSFGLPLVIATVVTAIFTVLAAVLAGIKPFVGAPPRLDEPSAESHADDRAAGPRDPAWPRLLGPLVLAGAGLVAGLAPGLFAKPMVMSTAASIAGSAVPESPLSALGLLWPPTLATALSIAALVLGIVLFALRGAWRRATDPIAAASAFGPDRRWNAALDGLMATGRLVATLLRGPTLTGAVRGALIAIVAIIGLAAWRAGPRPDLKEAAEGTTLLDGAVVAVLVISAIAAPMVGSRMGTIAVLGGAGAALAAVFLLYGAPDLSMTTIAVETLVVVIASLVAAQLPRIKTISGAAARIRDLGIAASFGLLVGWLALSVAGRSELKPVSDEHVLRSVPEAYGRNVVNVILVDFRALDTLGEIFVLGAAAVGVTAMLGTARRRGATP
ncbi:MAG TPA: proton-conducting transporter membrane subunit [Phycisphaerales bacterium]|nr:proton-conducting transporter membrane subunit [Phycisphaerales bacterium]HMP36893.1 proton-conducting transporter membrane subunit [Phycisphaerales bacterium]